MLGDSETEATWTSLFTGLKARGLKGVELVVSDDHKGLKAAAARYFQGAMWQRIFASGSQAEARERFRQLVDELDGKAEKAIETLENGLDDALSVMVLPGKYRRRLATTNMQERLNEEIRRRERVIRVFANEASAKRLIGGMLAEKHEAWSTGRRYFDMTEFYEWREARSKDRRAKVRSIK